MDSDRPLRGALFPRVLHVTTAHRADDVRIFERECRSLASTGKYEVFLAAAGAVPADVGVNLIPLVPAPSSRVGRFTAGPAKVLALTGAVAADLWHFHDPELLPVALKLARSGHRVIWDAHEDYVSQFSEAGAKSWVPGFARQAVLTGTRAMLRQMDKHAAGVVAATSTIASRYTNPRTVVVGNEARLELFAECRPDFASRQVLFTGSPGPGHLFREVVEAVAQVPDTSLAVAGREPDPATWAAANRVLGRRLQHLGWLSRSGLAEAMSASALGLLTYANTPAYAVASPTKAFEFGAAGLPMVATPNEMNVRALGKSGAGLVAADFSSRALADSIHAALADESEWMAASVAGRRWAAREGSWALSEERLLALYTEVMR